MKGWIKWVFFLSPCLYTDGSSSWHTSSAFFRKYNAVKKMNTKGTDTSHSCMSGSHLYDFFKKKKKKVFLTTALSPGEINDFLSFRKIRALLLLLIWKCHRASVCCACRVWVKHKHNMFFGRTSSENPREGERSGQRYEFLFMPQNWSHLLLSVNHSSTHICLLRLQTPAWRSCWGMSTLRRVGSWSGPGGSAQWQDAQVTPGLCPRLAGRVHAHGDACTAGSSQGSCLQRF